MSKGNKSNFVKKTDVNFSEIYNCAEIELAKRELASRNILEFVKYVNPSYKPEGFPEAYCKIIDAWLNFKITKLIISVPPQHGKSEVSTRKVPAFIAAKMPERKIAVVSYNATKAKKFGREIKLVIESKLFRNIFSKVRLAGRKDLNNINTAGQCDFISQDKSGTFFFVGRDGGINGEPVDDFIFDDLYSGIAEGNSPVIRHRVIAWYNAVAEARLHNDSRQLIIFTRWHEKDLIGYIKSKEKVIELTSFSQLENADKNCFYYVNFEAIKTGPPTEIDPRKPGEALLPWKHSLEKLKRVQARDLDTFNAVYQGNPVAVEGLLYNKGFGEYEKKPEIKARLAYIDTADTGKDKICCVCYDLCVDDYLYVTDIYYSAAAAEDTENDIAEMIIRNKVTRYDIESNSGGRQYGRNIKRILQERNFYSEINPFFQSGNKESRIITNKENVQHYILMPFGWVGKFPEFATDVLSFRAEFSANEHDDGPDTLTGCLEKSGVLHVDDFGLGGA